MSWVRRRGRPVLPHGAKRSRLGEQTWGQGAAVTTALSIRRPARAVDSHHTPFWETGQWPHSPPCKLDALMHGSLLWASATASSFLSQKHLGLAWGLTPGPAHPLSSSVPRGVAEAPCKWPDCSLRVCWPTSAGGPRAATLCGKHPPSWPVLSPALSRGAPLTPALLQHLPAPGAEARACFPGGRTS